MKRNGMRIELSTGHVYVKSGRILGGRMGAMKKILHRCILILTPLLLLTPSVGAQAVNRDSLERPAYVFRDLVARDSVKTVLLHPPGIDVGDPILELNRPNRLILRFDELSGVVMDLSYTLIHCNADWTRSDLTPFDYMRYNTEGFITEYSFSRATFQQYVNYSLSLPNEDVSPSISGNYALVVYEDGNEDNIILIRRLMVVEPKVDIDATVTRTKLIKYDQTHQEINFTVRHEGLNVVNAFQEVKVNVLQNQRWDNAKTGLQPIFTKEQSLVYDGVGNVIFPAGKEFRHFDLRSLIYRTDRVASLSTDHSVNIVQLTDDPIRVYKQYFFNNDINGKFVVDVKDSDEKHRESDYAHVFFTLPVHQAYTNGDIHIFGKLTDWNVSERTKMQYNYEKRQYECSLYLKQGYYNYEYIYIDKDNPGDFDQAMIEGNYFEAENDYLICVYYREIGGRYDQLIGIKQVNTLNQ